MRLVHIRGLAAVAAALVSGLSWGATEPPLVAEFRPDPAERAAFPTQTMMLDAARAGARIVAVGDRGVILLSDDDGKRYRQARSVPVGATLTSVSFIDEKNGWAVGHWGAILRTTDGGESWTQQRLDVAEDRPLFAVHFTDAQHGVAVGLWSLVLRTDDGGAHWLPVELPAPPGERFADRNLFAAFGSGRIFYVAGERGTVLSSHDGGQTWTYHMTGYRGSFWTGTAFDDGTVLVAGMRGNVYRSSDGGMQWTEIDSGVRTSLTSIQHLNGETLAVGLDGVILSSRDEGRTFKVTQQADRQALTAVVPLRDGAAALFARGGVVPAQP
ncbi:WD40/YVTN/BNR-like repeat-containing protein [Nitrogeniibacter aestuarii]|uniref:WD40/YVTN/BNR-like repeat-containing protein n=1 Tax=Nitrogeniibacter aestuarii TaxID=2815343 RepID=UPI001D0FBE15|nr:YCF48-related protein [Nitrogeniibacter aestuarii]